MHSKHMWMFLLQMWSKGKQINDGSVQKVMAGTVHKDLFQHLIGAHDL